MLVGYGGRFCPDTKRDTMKIDALISERPKMPTVSRELFNSSRFVACVTRAGLIVQSHRTGTGKLLPHTHQQYADYVEAIETVMDTEEGDVLCRALM